VVFQFFWHTRRYPQGAPERKNRHISDNNSSSTTPKQIPANKFMGAELYTNSVATTTAIPHQPQKTKTPYMSRGFCCFLIRALIVIP
jgi:hypothetical protein